MTTETTAPDAALLWAREFAKHQTGRAFHEGIEAGMFDNRDFVVSAAEAFRAGQSHADAGLLAALEWAIEWIIEHGDSGDAGFWDARKWPQVIAARAAIAAAKRAGGRDAG